jgi:hypothetical protein
LEQFNIMATIESPDLNDKPTWKLIKEEVPPPVLAPSGPASESSSGSGGGGGWVPPREKWKGGEPESSSGRPGWWTALEEKIWGDEEEAAAWRAKAKAAVEQGVATIGTAVVDLKQRTVEATQAARDARDARMKEDQNKKEKGGKNDGIGGRVNAMLKRGEKEVPLNGLWGFPLERLAKSDKHCELAYLSPVCSHGHFDMCSSIKIMFKPPPPNITAAHTLIFHIRTLTHSHVVEGGCCSGCCSVHDQCAR